MPYGEDDFGEHGESKERPFGHGQWKLLASKEIVGERRVLSVTRHRMKWFMKKRPNLEFLKIFGGRAYIHNPKHRRHGKFDPRALKGTLVRYRLFNAYVVILCKDSTIVETKNVNMQERNVVVPDGLRDKNMMEFDFVVWKYNLRWPWKFHLRFRKRFRTLLGSPTGGDEFIPMSQEVDCQIDSLDDLTYYAGLQCKGKHSRRL